MITLSVPKVFSVLAWVHLDRNDALPPSDNCLLECVHQCSESSIHHWNNRVVINSPKSNYYFDQSQSMQTTLNQSELEEDACNRRWARENARVQVVFVLVFWLVEKNGAKFLANHIDLPTSRAQIFFFGNAISEARKTQKTERRRAHHRNRKWEAKDFWESLPIMKRSKANPNHFRHWIKNRSNFSAVN